MDLFIQLFASSQRGQSCRYIFDAFCHWSRRLKKQSLLTKSRFKVGSECPTKLFYLDNQEYGNKKADDPFLRALAEGGFQVGELAKLYHPGGIEIAERDYDNSAASTNALLQREAVTIFEAAIRYDNLFVRVDVLKKSDKTLEVIEVKAKSFDPTDDTDFFTKKGTIRSEWESYLLDVAFQTYVTRKAFPNLETRSYLMLADKSVTATVDGVNQRFLISRDSSGRPSIKVRPDTTKEQLGSQVLCKINVDEPVNYVINKMFGGIAGWEKHVSNLAKFVTTSTKAPPTVSTECKTCEFRIDTNKLTDKKSGFYECWETAGVSESDLAKPMVFDIWNFRKSQTLIEERRYFIHQVSENDISPKEGDEPGLTSSQRQWIQVQKANSSDKTAYIDLDGLADEFRRFKYPLHFIDFETSMTALPFNKGRRPYEQVAFQFSHHIVDRDGSIRHAGQFIHRERGTFPNFTFVRELKKSLEKDQGSIFRYSHHENTVLRQIHDQIVAARDTLPDADELLRWIDSVTTVTADKVKRVGSRTMIDLCDLVKKYYYSAHTNGSNSIKKVLPAVFRDSEFLRTKYKMPIYGSENGPSSLNFSNWTWLTTNTNGEIIDPYKLLPAIFTDEELEQIEPMVNASEIADGGAAMMAYALMQFTEMSEAEARKIQDALLKYCELDTFAMVMIFEHWNHKIGAHQHIGAA
jgi:hypothetical protein